MHIGGAYLAGRPIHSPGVQPGRVAGSSFIPVRGYRWQTAGALPGVALKCCKPYSVISL